MSNALKAKIIYFSIILTYCVIISIKNRKNIIDVIKSTFKTISDKKKTVEKQIKNS